MLKNTLPFIITMTNKCNSIDCAEPNPRTISRMTIGNGRSFQATPEVGPPEKSRFLNAKERHSLKRLSRNTTFYGPLYSTC